MFCQLLPKFYQFFQLERISIEVRRTKTEVITKANQKRGNDLEAPMRTKMETSHPPKLVKSQANKLRLGLVLN